MIKPSPFEIQQFMTRGVTRVIPSEELAEKLASGERMRIYLGVDPTGADIHLGHCVVLRKLRQLQLWGHEIIFLIGDFTAQIGDPTGRDVMRKPLSHEEVLANARDYQKQVGRIVSFEGENSARIRYNSEWLSPLNFVDIIKLAGHFTVQQMLERDMFQERIKLLRPIGLHEFLYPLMVGYDCIMLDVDMEVGGNDQLFNIMAGRTLMMSMQGKSKIVFTCDLLEGTDGRKMSKSYGNVINVMDSPSDMFGKIMSIQDQYIARYYELCTEVMQEEIDALRSGMAAGKINPRDAKAQLAREIISLYHSSDDARAAQEQFEKVFRAGEVPDDIQDVMVPLKEIQVQDLLVETGLVATRTEARRMVEQGGVKINQKKIDTWNEVVSVVDGDIVQVGKRKFVRVR